MEHNQCRLFYRQRAICSRISYGPNEHKASRGNVVIIAAALNKFPYSLVARKEIRRPSQLVGEKIGIVNFGGSNDRAITLALKEWGIPRQAVTLIRSGDTASRLLALSNGAIFLAIGFTAGRSNDVHFI